MNHNQPIGCCCKQIEVAFVCLMIAMFAIILLSIEIDSNTRRLGTEIDGIPREVQILVDRQLRGR